MAETESMSIIAVSSASELWFGCDKKDKVSEHVVRQCVANLLMPLVNL